MKVHYKFISSNSHQSLLSNLDAEYRIELDQYKEESDSDVSWKLSLPLIIFTWQLLPHLGNDRPAQATSEECDDSYLEVARPRRSHHHWENRFKIWKMASILFLIDQFRKEP